MADRFCLTSPSSWIQCIPKWCKLMGCWENSRLRVEGLPTNQPNCHSLNLETYQPQYFVSFTYIKKFLPTKLRLMDEVKKISNDLTLCFKDLASVKAELLLQEDSNAISEEFPRLWWHVLWWGQVGTFRSVVKIHECSFKLKGLKGAAYRGSRVKLSKGRIQIMSSPFDDIWCFPPGKSL